MTKTSGNCFYIANLYFPCYFVNAFGLAVLSYCLSSFITLLLYNNLTHAAVKEKSHKIIYNNM